MEDVEGQQGEEGEDEQHCVLVERLSHLRRKQSAVCVVRASEMVDLGQLRSGACCWCGVVSCAYPSTRAAERDRPMSKRRHCGVVFFIHGNG